jgi:hypothetical protein
MARRAPATSDPVSEASYFQTIEAFFVERRGPPLFLSNPDWLLIRKWHKAGTPLRIVMRGIEEALDGHAHSWGRKHSVGSLQYCARSVDAARERWHRALSMRSDQAEEAALFLRAYADRLAEAPLGPAASGVAARLASELRERASGPLDAAGLEDWLSAGEGKLIAAIGQDGGQERVDALRTEVDRDLAAYASRLPPKVLLQIRESAVARRLLAAHGLDRLSLVQL